jgi:hypothetical protein
MKNTSIILILLLFLASATSKGQTCCSGGVPISTNLGLPPSFAGTAQFTLTYDINVLRTLKEGTTTIEDRARERITRSIILSAGYSITDRIGMEVLLPWVRQERNIEQPGGFSDFEDTQGIGDLLLLFKYRVTSVNNQRHVLSVGAGPKMPTGSAREVNGRGLILNADLQPGSGAWDGIFWTNYIYHMSGRPTMSLYSVLTYRLTGTNENYLNSTSTYKIGNNFRALIGVSDQIKVGSIMVNPNLGFRFRKAREDRFNGDPVTSTGGEWAFIVPGIGVGILPNLTVETNFEVPIYANPSGTQLTPTYRVNVGLHYVLSKKDKGIKNFID